MRAAGIAERSGAAVALAAIPPALAGHAAFAPYRAEAERLKLVAAANAGDTVGAGGERGSACIHPALAALPANGLPVPGADVEDAPAFSCRLIAPPARALGALEFERRLVEHNELIVRPGNLHDTVNALVWHVFPRSKRAISETHVALGVANTANGRPRRRDVLTLFDEAGALIVSEQDELRALHEAHAWEALFVTRRAEFRRACRVILFGHGTLEQLASNPHRGLTVKAVWLHRAAHAPLSEIDRSLSEGIRAGSLLAADEPRLPLPILGVPGWFAENEQASCYHDVAVFRPRRRTLTATFATGHARE